MKVAVSASKPSLDVAVDPRLGRCAYFVAVDTETMSFEGIENSNAASAQGAGIATAQMIAGAGVEVVLTGNCGPNAYQTLEAAGIKVITGVTGSVGDAVKDFVAGRYQQSLQPNVASHFGMGMGQGKGQGMGGGSGRGMGRGMSSDMGTVAPPATSKADSGLIDILEGLRVQLADLRTQVSDIDKRIEKLHKDD